jgi:hypothetical protein
MLIASNDIHLKISRRLISYEVLSLLTPLPDYLLPS